MNKKNWKKRFEGLDFMVKVKDSFGWTKEINYEMLEDFIQQEIDRARENSRMEALSQTLALTKVVPNEIMPMDMLQEVLGNEIKYCKERLSKLTK